MQYAASPVKEFENWSEGRGRLLTMLQHSWPTNCGDLLYSRRTFMELLAFSRSLSYGGTKMTLLAESIPIYSIVFESGGIGEWGHTRMRAYENESIREWEHPREGGGSESARIYTKSIMVWKHIYTDERWVWLYAAYMRRRRRRRW